MQLIIEKLDKAQVEKILGRLKFVKLTLAKTYITEVSIPTLKLFKAEVEEIMHL